MKRKSQKGMYILLFFTIFILTVFLLSLIEAKFLPPLQEISHMQCKAITNNIINDAAAENIRSLDHAALLQKNGESYTTNTALVNQLCIQLSRDITNNLQKLSTEKIRIPFGAASDSSFLANKGPLVPFTMTPMGTVKVDYESSFTSVGINQLNYKIWIDISVDVKIVNPLNHETLQMHRKIMLADLIFGGKVPAHYVQFSPSDEYVLTE